MNLYRRSLDIILANQSPSGAYVASPSFPSYQYCWFRDGAFIAYAMNLAGQHSSAARFYDWAAHTILKRETLIRTALDKAAAGQPLVGSDYLHTRYTLEGEEGTRQEWPNFQLDGFGTWLWSLDQHHHRFGQRLPAAWIQAVQLVAAYLSALWRLPCYDCWEEYPDEVHPHTLAAIYAGLGAASRLTGEDYSAVQAEISAFIEAQAVYDGYFVKYIGSYTVDTSLIGLATPYRLVKHDDPRLCATVERIERSLLGSVGVHRYPTDTYFGGGEWVLLAGWLGWYYAESGNIARAQEMLAWMESQADAEGCLPEQVPLTLNDPNYYQPWVRHWGEIARPLLWSHANYIILQHAINPQFTDG